MTNFGTKIYIDHFFCLFFNFLSIFQLNHFSNMKWKKRYDVSCNVICKMSWFSGTLTLLQFYFLKNQCLSSAYEEVCVQVSFAMITYNESKNSIIVMGTGVPCLYCSIHTVAIQFEVALRILHTNDPITAQLCEPFSF